MFIETKIVGRRTPFERRPIDCPAGPHTLQELIGHLIAHEVAAYHDRQDSHGALRVMTEQQLQDGAAQGRIQIAPQEKSGTVTVTDATHTALRSFQDGLYYVFVDDQQIEHLDQVVTLRDDSTLLLLRLTALAGG